MNEINIGEQQKIPVNATEIINKYRKLEDRLNFCLEKNWFHPQEIGYDSNFFLSVIKGDKKYLPNNFTVNYNIGYFRNGEKLDKRYIIDKMKSNNAYALYTPDICDPTKFSKSFLLKLVAYVDPNLFRELYSINKRQKAERNYNRWADFKIDIKREFINDIKEFNSINNGKNNRGGFRRTKNHNPSNLFYQFQGRINQNQNNLNLRNQNYEANINLRNQIQELNQTNNIVINENQKLKNEIQELKQQLILKNHINIDKDIQMRDDPLINSNKNINRKNENSPLGKINQPNNNDENIKAKIIEMKLQKKK